jgi:putative endonuclease
MASRHLEARGYAILERNFRCRSGEVDIVARLGEATVFVEVKERSADSHGAGHEAVTFGKRRRILRAARIYAASRGLSETPLRFDVISIDWASGAPHLRHDEDAFGDEGG